MNNFLEPAKTFLRQTAKNAERRQRDSRTFWNGVACGVLFSAVWVLVVRFVLWVVG